MIDEKIYRVDLWNSEKGEDFCFAKKAIISILNNQKVSLSKTRHLFNVILQEIEDKNPINL